MPPQRSCADVEYDGQPRQTWRERVLQRMEARMPWARLEARMRPVDPTGTRGRPPDPLALLLRMHCVPVLENRSDPAMEDALDDSVAGQRFVGLTTRGPRPDETTILNFRHLLEGTTWVKACWRRSPTTWRRRACGCGKARSWTRRRKRAICAPRRGARGLHRR